MTMMGVILSYAALASSVPGVGAPQADICAPDSAACRLQVAAPEPEEYATPVEVDCPAPVVAASTGGGAGATAGTAGTAAMKRGVADPPWFSSGCAAPSLDLRYRVSRFPESERSAGGLLPQRGRRAARTGSTVSGLPSNQAGATSTPLPPLALYARPALSPPPWTAVEHAASDCPPTRALAPPERPPRA